MNEMKSPKFSISNFYGQKRKHFDCDDCDTDSLLFLATAAKKVVPNSSPKRKKFKHFLESRSKNVHLSATPRERRLNQGSTPKERRLNQGSTPKDSDSTSGDDNANSFLDGLSVIFASDAEESYGTSSYSNKLNLTGENFDDVMQEAELLSDAESNESDKQYFLKKREEFANNQRKFKSKAKKNEMSPTLVIPVLERGALVVLLKHPSSITLYKYVSVEVLSGSVSICGHELNTRSMSARVFSSEQTGLAELKTEGSDHLLMRQESFMNLHRKLRKIFGDNDKVRTTLDEFGNSSVLILIEGVNYPPHLEFLKLYYPNVMQFKKEPSMKFREYLSDQTEWTVRFGSDAEDLAEEISRAIRYSKLHDMSGPRVVVFGPKNTGKSSLLRYLMNKILTMFSGSVYYLDTDPGQAEFTPPGVVSLTDVKDRVLGPPFCHQRQPVSMTFVGSVSADCPDIYNNSVAKMVSLFNQNYVKETLLVNTMGWVQGFGLACLQNTLKSVQPTILVELVTENNDTMFDYREYLPENAQYYQISSPFEIRRSTPHLSPKEMRELSLLSYLGKCQPVHMLPSYLNSFQPYRVCYDKIPIYFTGRKVPPYKMVDAINGSIVALCCVDESLILQSTIPEFPKTLEHDPDNECLGFGLVRAIDEKNRLLLIVSPMKLDEIQRVNAIIKGNIMVPSCVFINQPITGFGLPFTDYRSAVSFHEEDSQKSKVLHKAIPKRYGKNTQN